MSKQSVEDDCNDERNYENYTDVSIRDDIISMTFYRIPINNIITVKEFKEIILTIDEISMLITNTDKKLILFYEELNKNGVNIITLDDDKFVLDYDFDRHSDLIYKII